MRILLVEGTGKGFLAHYSLALALGLAERGDEVRLLAPTDGEFKHTMLPVDVCFRLKSGAAAWQQLRKEVAAYRPDIVHLQWVGHPLAALRLVRYCRRQGVRVLYTPHNLLPHRYRWLTQPLYAWLYQALDAIVARDSHIAWGLQELLDIPRDRSQLIPGSPNLLASEQLPSQLPAELATGAAGAVRLLQFGYGGRKKGTRALLEALLALPHTDHLQLILAGQGVLKDVPQSLADAARQRMRLTVIDRYIPATEVASIFSFSDLLLMPYQVQCDSPLIDLARALETPVLRSDRVSHPDFREGVDGYTFRAGTPAELERHLALLLEAPQQLAALRQQARGRQTERQLLARLVTQHHALYGRLLKRSEQRLERPALPIQELS